jgi:hypothetical protein
MNMLKTGLLAALIALSASAAQAFTPPYHINGTPIVGTATFASSGTCKVPAKKFPNAKYGAIYDSNDNSVGAGVIDANGSAILALEAGGMQSYMKYFIDNNAPQKADMKTRVSFMDIAVANYVMAQSGCMMMSWWTQPSSFFQVKQDLAKGTMDVAMKQSFIGDIQPDLNHCTSVNNVVKCNKSLQFKGSMSFKGRALIP